MSSLHKFVNQRVHNGKLLHWGRLDEDGLPFRGVAPPPYRQDEWDERIKRVADPRNGIFDVADPEQNAVYLAVLDGIVNNWFQLVVRRWLSDTRVYVEWVEFFLEDGSRAPLLGPSMGAINVAALQNQTTFPGQGG